MLSHDHLPSEGRLCHMSAFLNQTDLPGRELICVNDASVCKCLTQITMIPGLIVEYWAAILFLSSSPVSLVVSACFHVSVFQLKNAKYALHVHVRLWYTGLLTDEECDFICFLRECWMSVMRIFRRGRKKVLQITYRSIFMATSAQRLIFTLTDILSDESKFCFLKRLYLSIKFQQCFVDKLQ